MIRYAVVGAGWISQEAFLPGISQSGNSEVAAIFTGDMDKAGKLAAFHGIPNVHSYEDFDTILKSDSFDAVYVALPNTMHADYAIRAARAGKHILVEKPLANTVSEAEAMIAAAREGGVFLMTAYRLHNEPGTLAVLDHIRAGKIGTPLLFQGAFTFQTDLNNHRLKAKNWGGPLQDVGVYCLNAVRHIFQEEPVEVTAIRYRPEDDPRFTEVESSLAATLRFPSGRIAQFVVSFGAAVVDAYRVIGTEGDLELDPAFRFETPTRLRLRQNGVTRETEFPHVDHFGGMTTYFSDCILARTPPEPDGEEGLADMIALHAIEEAARTGLPVKLSVPPRPRHPARSMEHRKPLTDKRLVF